VLTEIIVELTDGHVYICCAQVDFAYAAGDGATGNAAEQQQEGRSAREGRLWANLFVYSLDAGNTQARAPFSWKPHVKLHGALQGCAVQCDLDEWTHDAAAWHRTPCWKITGPCTAPSYMQSTQPITQALISAM
jgi:hypothetical protein